MSYDVENKYLFGKFWDFLGKVLTFSRVASPRLGVLKLCQLLGPQRNRDRARAGREKGLDSLTQQSLNCLPLVICVHVVS